jgi:putative ABC transport system ATP-binding protein
VSVRGRGREVEPVEQVGCATKQPADQRWSSTDRRSLAMIRWQVAEQVGELRVAPLAGGDDPRFLHRKPGAALFVRSGGCSELALDARDLGGLAGDPAAVPWPGGRVGLSVIGPAADKPRPVEGRVRMARAARGPSVERHTQIEEAVMSVTAFPGPAPVAPGPPTAVGPPLIRLEGVEKVYRTGKVEFPALRGIDLTIADGEMVAIVGPSGSGKSTIMNMITGIDRPTAGTVTVREERIDRMSEEELAVWRGHHVGVVFQFFQLLPTLTALENAMLPLDFARQGSKRERRARALHNLELVGLADMADRLPSEMSGGQQQRVAIARALASYPTLVIGDEPTGNLDTKTAAEMFELLQRVCSEGATVLYVTHDLELAARADRTITIRDGLVVDA